MQIFTLHPSCPCPWQISAHAHQRRRITLWAVRASASAAIACIPLPDHIANAGELRSEVAVSIAADPRQALSQIAKLLQKHATNSPQESLAQNIQVQLQDQVEQSNQLVTKLNGLQLRSSWSLESFQLQDLNAPAEASMHFLLGQTRLHARRLSINGTIDLSRLNLGSRFEAEVRLDAVCEDLRVEVVSPLKLKAKVRLNTDAITAYHAEVLHTQIESSDSEPQFKIELGNCQGPVGVNRWLEPILAAKLQQEFKSQQLAVHLQRAAQNELDAWFNGQSQKLTWRENELELRMIGAKPMADRNLLKFDLRLRHPLAPTVFIPWSQLESTPGSDPNATTTTALARPASNSNSRVLNVANDSLALLVPIDLAAQILDMQVRYETHLIESQKIAGFQSLMNSRWKQFFAFPELMNFPKSARFLFAVQIDQGLDSQQSSSDLRRTQPPSMRFTCVGQSRSSTTRSPSSALIHDQLQIQVRAQVQMLRRSPRASANSFQARLASIQDALPETLPFAHFNLQSLTTWSLSQQQVLSSQTQSRSHFDKAYKPTAEAFDSSLLADGVDDALQGLRLQDLMPSISSSLDAMGEMKCVDKWLQISPTAKATSR